MDLGADGLTDRSAGDAPVISTAWYAGGLLAFALSLDEVIVTTFTAGAQKNAAPGDLGQIARPEPAAGQTSSSRLDRGPLIPAL